MNPQIIITEVDGQVGVQANVTDKLRLIGMLEIAKSAILAPQPQLSPIVQAAVVPRLNGGVRGHS